MNHIINFDRKHFPKSLKEDNVLDAYTDDPCIGDKAIAHLGLPHLRVSAFGEILNRTTFETVGQLHGWDIDDALFMAKELALNPTKVFTRTLEIYDNL